MDCVMSPKGDELESLRAIKYLVCLENEEHYVVEVNVMWRLMWGLCSSKSCNIHSQNIAVCTIYSHWQYLLTFPLHLTSIFMFSYCIFALHQNLLSLQWTFTKILQQFRHLTIFISIWLAKSHCTCKHDKWEMDNVRELSWT